MSEMDIFDDQNVVLPYKCRAFHLNQKELATHIEEWRCMYVFPLDFRETEVEDTLLLNYVFSPRKAPWKTLPYSLFLEGLGVG